GAPPTGEAGGQGIPAPAGGAATDAAGLVPALATVERLVAPSRNEDVLGGVMEIALACMMWEEPTPLRGEKDKGSAIGQACGSVIGHMPETIKAVLDRAAAAPPAG
ncbi:MAG: hypothetical protein KDG89_04670, partial [Geminicoccaceae bacterium]|nr:hypothetical protein [Geminicoccaceae bacterium]